MEVQLAIIYGKPGKFSADLTQFFTGCRAYHICYVVPKSGMAYDQHLLFRRFEWAGKYKPEQVELYDCPYPITEEELIEEMLSDIDQLCNSKGSIWQRLLNTMYGWRDYLLWGLRPLYHALGKSTPNLGGRVCSGRIRDIGASRGWFALGKVTDPEPSPCDWAKYLAEKGK